MQQAAASGGRQYFDLLRAADALSNWRAVAILIGSGLLAGILVFLGSLLGIRTGSFLLSGLFGLLAMLGFSVGISAAGLVLMDQAQGLPSRSVASALVDGLFAALRVLAVALIGIVLVLAFYLAAALVLLLCKIPVLGPLLYAVSLPVLVVAAGMLFFSIYVALSMAGPAVWSGLGVRRAVAMLWQIAVHRMVELLVSLFLLTLLMMLVGGVVGAILGVGYASVLGLSVPILGGQAMGSLGGMLGGMGMYGSPFGYGGDFGGHAMAAAFGSMVLFALVGGALFSMSLLGMNLIYLRVTGDLDPSEAERLIEARMEEARQKAQELKEESARRAEEARERLRQRQEESRQAQAAAAPVAEPVVEQVAEPVPPAPVPVEPAPVPAASTCPKCQAPVKPEDRFCGECGNRLTA